MEKFKKSLKKAKKRHKPNKLPSASNYTFFEIAEDLKDIAPELSIDKIQVPPEHIEADLALTGDPKKVSEAAQKINSGDFKYFTKAESEGHFLNIFLKKVPFCNAVLKNLAEIPYEYGKSDLNLNKFALIEYSSPNVARPMAVGHLRSTIIGQVLANIYESTGCTVFRDNYLGDWGTQFGKLIYAYKNWGDKEKIKENLIENLKELYVRFQQKSEDNEKLVEEAREILKKLEEGDKKLLKLWKKFRELSIKEFEKIYKKLGIEFDHYGGESYSLKEAKNIPEKCLQEGICKEGKQSEVIAEIENFPTFLLRKGDGSTIYHSRDLAELKTRIEDLEPDQILYVVGSEQTLYFRQLFALAEKLGIDNNCALKHIGFGLVLGEDGKRMSTRHGTTVELEDLISKAIDKSWKLVEEKNPNLSREEKREIAFKVGAGAVIYNNISASREKDISFDWERMLNFEAGSSAYLQYTYARINSIISRYREKFKPLARMEKFSLEENIEFELVKKIMFFPQKIKEARENDSPHTIAVYLEELTGLFNTFYNKISIINTEDETLRNSRLTLAKGVGQVIKNGLTVLNVPVPEKM